ncbi:D-serine ammonia-lyase [Bariatricus massiliensis]|uniref:Probable D-serine dehydratase n=1 Tax=Bariatricus massiliensis TaxID=1745713 RepID=A0ABS8DDS6_9FIRM|nr:D-serine ammonia-lyase [Bariatricus massiliensis]MCB7302677.1 D-serine ammonia-lyase [Bariatricus massiliensis]MCB7373893.1 D-serine ammonia-lyase [Bariatricus massiliensis]MCB7386563.1 D-serine ammonia-lyase [Bariatricus massiliensis]MCB7410725.1 D-serine ammonia-lyase [Bariatricus massiliensis]MCQ5253437.1 D-serine ammonia-lyase [Bariatricus massiliensis]
MEVKNEIVKSLAAGEEVFWLNPKMELLTEERAGQELSMKDIEEAEQRLARFAPLIMKCFPETKDKGGLIESVLTPIPEMQKLLNEKYHAGIKGKLILKQDSHLAIAGSIKARGGIYEVLKHTEELALAHGLITGKGDYERLASEENRRFFSEYTIQVGSTGNLGMSIGIMSAALGYQAVVHMSADAKEWKKKLLRSHGVTVIEYDSDYSEAVIHGRKLSDENPKSYFVDDENSKDLFLGYAVAAKRLEAQLKEQQITVDGEHSLFVYLPCGVGGAPGGITFGLKQLFGDNVHCFFVEPVQAPSMLLGMATGLHNEISVQDIGLTGMTHADGLAVGRPSGFVGKVMEPLLGGIFTVKDGRLYEYMRDMLETQDIFLEPSACAAFAGPAFINNKEEAGRYIAEQGLTDKMDKAVHIAWATGGSLVPQEIREAYKNTYLDVE